MFLDKFIDGLISLPGKIAGKFKPPDALDARVERYTDVEGVPTKTLDVGLWYREHTKIFFLIIVWLLSAAAAILWSFSLYYLGYYLTVGLKQDRENLAQLSQSVDVIRYDYDVNFKILPAQALPAAAGHYDLIGQLVNTNSNVWGAFNYYFLVDGRRVGNGNGFILPNEQKSVVSFNQILDYPPSQVQLMMETFGWRRLNAHSIPDWERYKTDRFNFIIQDKVFLPANESGLTENLPVNQLSFTITNQSAFAFRQAPFLILLYANQALAGVNTYTFIDFKPRQKTTVNLTILGKLPKITDIVIVPDINILDENVFRALD